MSKESDNLFVTKALRWGAIFAAILAILAGGVGWFFAETGGLWAGLLGAGLAFVFLGITSVSIIFARRISGNDVNNPVFYGIVSGVWLVKLVLFFLVFLWIPGQEWLNPFVFLITVIVVVTGSLILDGLAFVLVKVPYVEVDLPGGSEKN